MATSNMVGSTIWNYKMGQADFCFIDSALILTQYLKVRGFYSDGGFTIERLLLYF